MKMVRARMPALGDCGAKDWVPGWLRRAVLPLGPPPWDGEEVGTYTSVFFPTNFEGLLQQLSFT